MDLWNVGACQQRECLSSTSRPGGVNAISGSQQKHLDYLLMGGLGYRMMGILDHRRVEELLRINGDLDRLGGLLKLWLTNDERTGAFGEATIQALLGKIEHTQGMM